MCLIADVALCMQVNVTAMTSWFKEPGKVYRSYNTITDSYS